MISQIITILQQAKRVAIFSHQNPDGDAMGSSYALKLALHSLGKQAEVFLCDGWETGAYELVYGKESAGLAVKDCDLLVALDSADQYRLGGYEQVFVKHPNTIAIDHHITHKPFAGQTMVQDISSTCELLYGVIKELGVAVDCKIASNLYLGMVSDTGNFKYESVTGDTLRAAAELIDTGIDFAKISKQLFSTKSIGYMKLMRIALDKLSFYLDGQVAVLHLNAEDFEAAGIQEEMAVGIVTLPGTVEGVEVGVYIRVRSSGECKVSLRSARRIDVAAIAKKLGGGGHVRASGYTAETRDVEQITQCLLKEIENQL